MKHERSSSPVQASLKLIWQVSQLFFMITVHLSHTMALIYELWDCVGKWKSVWICGAAQQNLKKNVNTMIKRTSKWSLSTGSHISIQSDWKTFCFIRNYSSKAAPLTVLTSGKWNFWWSPEANSAFCTLLHDSSLMVATWGNWFPGRDTALRRDPGSPLDTSRTS